jgi:hypothetical protein
MADPLSKKELEKGNTYTQAVKDRIAYLLRAGGGALLNSGAPNDATAQGQEARRAALEKKAMGQ